MTTAGDELLGPRAQPRAAGAPALLRRVELPIPDAVEHLVGLQGQAPVPPYYGLWSRLEGFDPHELGRLLTDREAVRLTLWRATVHLVTVRDALRLRPLMGTVIERNHNGAFGRRMGGESWTGRELDTEPSMDQVVLRYLAAFRPGFGDGRAELVGPDQAQRRGRTAAPGS